MIEGNITCNCNSTDARLILKEQHSTTSIKIKIKEKGKNERPEVDTEFHTYRTGA